MDKQDLDKWCRRKGLPVVKFLRVFPAKLRGYKLTFNYLSSSRNAGAANIMESKEGCVYGLLIEMEEDHLNTVRIKEGCPNYYREICVDVEKFDGTIVRDAITYKVAKHQETTSHQPPTRNYLQLIIRNAEKYGFPRDYIKYLKTVPAKD